MTGVIGVKSVDIEDEVVSNWARLQIDERAAGRTRFLLDDAVERLDSCRGDRRVWTRPEAGQLRQVGKIGHYDGPGDVLSHHPQERPQPLLELFRIVPIDHIVGSRPERDQIGFGSELLRHSHLFLDKIDPGSRDAQVDQEDTGDLPIQFTGDQIDVAFGQGHRSDTRCIARTESEVNELDGFFLRASARRQA